MRQYIFIFQNVILNNFNKRNLDQLNIISKSEDYQDDDNLIKSKKNSVNNVLILDTETTGLDETKDEVIEVGSILFNIQSKSILSQVSFLLPVTSNPAEHINQISVEVSNLSQPSVEAMTFFLKLVDHCDFIIAHNAEFDKKWFGSGKLPKLNKKWICSLEDINWSFKKNLKPKPSVSSLALAFGIPVWNLHRALSDCYYLSEVFKRCDNLEEILLNALKPRYLYKALVSYEERSLAKNAGFLWNSHIQGAWTRKLSEEEATKLNFKVEILG